MESTCPVLDTYYQILKINSQWYIIYQKLRNAHLGLKNKQYLDFNIKAEKSECIVYVDPLIRDLTVCYDVIV